MADEPRTPSRRDRRVASETPATDAPAPTVSQAPEIRAGFAFTTEIPVGQMSAAGFGDVPGLASAGTPVIPQQAAPTGDPSDVSGLSRRDRRRIERLENPMETWSAEEETHVTGQMPTMTPQVIANEEALSRQRAAIAQADARLATGEVPLVGMPGIPGETAPRPMVIAPSPDGGVPPSLQHLFPPGPVQVPVGQPGAAPMAGMPQERPPARPPQPQGPSIDEHGRLVAPVGAAPLVVPGFADGTPIAGMQGSPQFAGQPGMPAVPGAQVPQPSQFAPQTAAFEALVAGGPPGGPKPPTVPVGQVQGFQQGPFAPPGMPPGVAYPGGGVQGVVVPGTGTLRTTGTLRPVPGTGAIPRPVIEVHPAGGVHHFGWVQLLLLAAAAFALGVVVWNVASRGS